MINNHLGPVARARFLEGHLGSAENRSMVRSLMAVGRLGQGKHLWSGVEEVADAWRAESSPALQVDLPSLYERAHFMAGERSHVPDLAARLDSLAPDEQRAALRSDPAFHSVPFCEWLVVECLRFAESDVNRAEDLANLAVVAAESLDAGTYGTLLVNDFKARAWGCVGEVLRVLTDLRNAEDAFTTAEGFIAEGTGDALEEARLLEARAALLRDQQRAVEAHRLLDEVIAVYRQYRDFHLVGRAYVQKGQVYGAADDLESAIRWLRKGIGLIDPTRERRLELAARHSLMLYLQESGRHQEAWFLLQASRPEFHEHGGELLRLRLRWLEGKILQARESPAEAELALLEARDGFVAQGIGFSAAMVSLDLASLYAGQGRAAEMRRLAEEMLPVFHSRDLHREASAAMIVLRQAIYMEKVSAGLLGEIRSYLGRAQKDYKLRFESLA